MHLPGLSLKLKLRRKENEETLKPYLSQVKDKGEKANWGRKGRWVRTETGFPQSGNSGVQVRSVGDAQAERTPSTCLFHDFA